MCQGLPSSFSDDHFCADIVETLPEVSALQLHLDLVHGGRGGWVACPGGQVCR